MRYLAATAIVGLLAACGGGGGSTSSGGGTTTPPVPVVTVSLVNSSGATVGTIGAGDTFTARARVTEANGTAIGNRTVNFVVTDAALAQLSPASALTNSSGIAEVTIAPTAASAGGATTLTASVVSGTDTTVSGTVDFAVTSSATGTPNVASIEVLSSSATLPSATANSVTVTALVKDSNNAGMANVPVLFAASSGVLQSVSTATDASGTATATLGTGADRSNRDIRVTVAAGALVGTVVVPVTGTTLSVVGVGSVLLGGTATYTVALRDSAGKELANGAIAVGSSLGNNVSPSALVTDVNGGATFNYTANNSGSDRLSLSGAGATASTVVTVSGEDFSVVTPAAGTEVFVNTDREVRVRYRSGGVGVAGRTVNFSTTRGAVSASSVLTDANGEAAVMVRSTTAGPALVTAQVSGGALTSVDVLFTASTPSSVVLQVNPGAIPPNPSGSSSNRAQLQAVVRDASGNPVKGRTVNFTLVADTSGGRLSAGTGTTDANGSVSDAFIPGPLSTAANGVQIQASVAGTGVQDVAAMTVSSQALFITIATSNTIGNRDQTTYSKPFSVRVTDANGTAVRSQVVTLSVFPLRYGKGNLVYPVAGPVWTYASGSPQWCPNEDANRDGVLQSGEDTNSDGSLTPGMPGTIPVASVTTDDTGFASFALEYGEQFAPWVQFEISARATVAGTESVSRMPFTAAVAADDVNDPGVTPAGRVSPFGITLDCSVAN
jgi:hypothetical protein